MRYILSFRWSISAIMFFILCAILVYAPILYIKEIHRGNINVDGYKEIYEYHLITDSLIAPCNKSLSYPKIEKAFLGLKHSKDTTGAVIIVMEDKHGATETLKNISLSDNFTGQFPVFKKEISWRHSPDTLNITVFKRGEPVGYLQFKK